MKITKVTISAYELLRKFPDAESARVYLEQLRWGGKPVCPRCEASKNQSRQKRRGKAGHYFCYHCKKTYTVRTGAIFDHSHIPLDKWIFAIYLVVTARKGISSLQLSKEIGVTQKTAWFLLHRVREACKNPDDCFNLLQGVVEADEVYMGGIEKNKHEWKKLKKGRGTVGKIAVLGMRERGEGGHTRCKVIHNTTARTVQAELNATIAEGATLCTDEAKVYRDSNYDHEVVNHSAKQFVDGMAHTNGIESIWAVLQRAYYGTYHFFTRKHLQRYVDEVGFRLNEGNVRIHTMDRIDALLGKAFFQRITYSELIAEPMIDSMDKLIDEILAA